MPLLDIHDQHLHVIDRGSGDAVLFLHAFPLRAAMWDYQIDALEETHRCLAVDLPGFGGSPPPEEPTRSTMRGWADLVAGALDQLEVPSATVVGSSMGGYLAMALLRHHPALVDRLVLVGTKALSDDAAAVSRRTDQQKQVESGTETSALAKGLVENLLSASSLAHEDLLAYVYALAEDATPEGWIGAIQAMKTRPDSMLVLRQAKLPALVAVGELDRTTPIAEAMSLRLHLKGTLEVIPNVGHLPNLEDPLTFNETLTKFLSETSEASADDDAGSTGEE